MDEIYPLTIINDRYTGAYSGGEFTAWNMDYYEIPTEPAEDDVTCMLFWGTTKIPVGRGETPQEAVEDLKRRLEALKDGSKTDLPIEYAIGIVENMPTLTPPNEWVNRVRELDELCTKIQSVTGFTAEQLLEMFAAGYTLERPDYSKHFEAMTNLAEAVPPNEPLTLKQLREMDGEPVWVIYDQDAAKTTPGFDPLALWALVEVTKTSVFLTNNLGGRTAYADDQDLERAGITIYRHPPEGEEDT